MTPIVHIIIDDKFILLPFIVSIHLKILMLVGGNNVYIPIYDCHNNKVVERYNTDSIVAKATVYLYGYRGNRVTRWLLYM